MVDKVLGWIMKLFPGGPSRRRPSKHLWYYNIWYDTSAQAFAWIFALCSHFWVARWRLQFVNNWVVIHPFFFSEMTYCKLQGGISSPILEFVPHFRQFFAFWLLLHILEGAKRKHSIKFRTLGMKDVAMQLYQWRDELSPFLYFFISSTFSCILKNLS